jgi:hypothetical protein
VAPLLLVLLAEADAAVVAPRGGVPHEDDPVEVREVRRRLRLGLLRLVGRGLRLGGAGLLGRRLLVHGGELRLLGGLEEEVARDHRGDVAVRAGADRRRRDRE